MPTVALVTCVALPELDPDEARLLTPLRDRGIVATPAIWNDQTVVWDAFDLTVIRCPWDYSEQRDHFLDWAHRVPRLCNSPSLSNGTPISVIWRTWPPRVSRLFRPRGSRREPTWAFRLTASGC